jgi:predicted TIM-barrel fold metal-dependent hydrolase
LSVEERIRSLRLRGGVVDAHHHLWNLSAVRYPWLEARGVKRFFGDPSPIQHDYLLDDFRADLGDLPIVASVHVQVGAAPGQELAETDWLEAESARAEWPLTIVAAVDLARDDAGELLEQQSARPTVRGVRHIIGREPQDDARMRSAAVLENALWRQNLASLVGRGLSFDAQLTLAQYAAFAAVLTDIPDLHVAICHCGSPWNQSASGLDAWRRDLRSLAAHPNAMCKLSGFGMFDPEWNPRSIRVLVDGCLDAFGPQRCMFGSNFPVEKLARDYRQQFAAVLSACNGLSDDALYGVFAGNARRFYRIAALGREPAAAQR